MFPSYYCVQREQQSRSDSGSRIYGPGGAQDLDRGAVTETAQPVVRIRGGEWCKCLGCECDMRSVF